MNYENLKETVKKIQMPDDMRARIAKNCESKTTFKAEDNIMNKKVTNNRSKKHASAIAVIAFCLCITIGVAASSNSGFFTDITDWNGAVTGTKYEQASDEIEICIVSEKDEITVFAVMLNPNVAPFRFIDDLGIDSYQIIDKSGNVIIEGDHSDPVEIDNGKAAIKIPTDKIEKGDYELVITSFAGYSKADQPLQITGVWNCGFTI